MTDYSDELQRSIRERSVRGEERGFESVVSAAREASTAGGTVGLSRAPTGPALALIAAVTALALGLWGLSMLVGGEASTQSVASSPKSRAVPGGESPSPTADPYAPAATSTTHFQTGPCPAPPTRPEHPTEADQRAFDDSVVQSQADAATGWLPFTSQDVVNGGWYCGWIRVPPRDPSEIIAAGNRQAVYDAQDGTVVGYAYVGVGFVPINVADAPGFDPSQLGGG